MNQDICQNCGSQKKLVPAGTSKRTGKKYAAFWACPDRECNKSTSYTPKAPQNVNLSDSGASSKRFEELMGAIGELSTQITDLRFLLEDINREIRK